MTLQKPTATTDSGESRPGMRGGRPKRMSAVVIGVVALALSAAVYSAWPTTMEHRSIESSYAYDVTNLKLLSGQADAIVIANVVGVSETDEEAGTTSFTIDVTDSIKGNLGGRQTVEQLGFVETTGKTHTTVEDPDQPLLQVGSTALLTLGQEPDSRLIVIGGPRSVVVLDDNQRNAVRVERATAARNAEPVRDQAGRVVLPVKDKPIR